MSYKKVTLKLHGLIEKEYAEKTKRFFKCEVGEYSHGDVFLGIRMGGIRNVAKNYFDLLEDSEIKKLIRSKFHEERMLGLIILVNQYKKAKSEKERVKIYNFYVASFKHINNWDLVDVTCPHIVGKHLLDKNRKNLVVWAKSKDLWTRRIAMVSNWWFIRNGDLSTVFKIAKLLLKDEHDLMHKAVGWMLREAYKKDIEAAETFLLRHYDRMPRTMLRYAIEKMPEKRRQEFLKGNA